ncbi:MAG: polyphosphate kinase 1 [Candidatus Methylacidiphilales bacterium]
MSQEINLKNPTLFMNRELSWLEFNQRVLEEALDPSTPLLERVKFLCIVSSNLDEFFEIRVSGIRQLIDSHRNDPGPDGLSSQETFDRIHERVTTMMQEQYRLWSEELLPALEENHIRFLAMNELSEDDRQWAERFFHDEVFPVLTPLAIDPSHPFPHILNKSLNIIVVIEGLEGADDRYAIVQVPRVLNRLITLPHRPAQHHDFLFLSRLIMEHVQTLFPGVKVKGAHPFRVTRNSDLYIDEEEALNLLRSIEEELRNRNKGNAVRLEVEQGCPAEVRFYLQQKFRLNRKDMYVSEGPMNLVRLMPLTDLDTHPSLKAPAWSPVTAQALRDEPDFFEVIRQQDILLHHPYESFGSVVDFVEYAATDPKVLAIKMTLYRTSGDSPIVKALIDASNRGKQITVLVELKARFDEANNISWARRLEDAGVHVVYGLVGLKTHCKTLLVVRRDDDRIRHYCHLGTGNYHPKTARLYTDLGLLTTRPELTSEVAALFNAMTGMSYQPQFSKLLVAPFQMRDRFVEMIRREAEHARHGRPGRIFAKMNSLVDLSIILELYQASQAGVKIDLMIRGICCLRPGLEGVSENITVKSIVDQFLEHSRIFYFHNHGQDEVYLGSADWMTRNLSRRVEVIFPVEDPRLKDRMIHGVIALFQQDNVKARYILPNGMHVLPVREENEPAIRAQEVFMKRALETHQAENIIATSPSIRLVPAESPQI